MKNLEPKLLWKYFYDITQTPRPSKKEEKIMLLIKNFASEHGLDLKQDTAGNILIMKNGTPGYEDKPALILQAHMDMVCEKNQDVVINFETDPIQTKIEGDWLKAEGTTLGADNGIGMAMMMAVLASDDLAHPPLECLFTVDEETGLTGAMALEQGFMSGKRLINLDSEDDGEVYIGCAGGKGTKAYLTLKREDMQEGNFAVKMGVKGLKGGHSGGDIHLGLGNSIQILTACLKKFSQETEIRINRIEGGNLHNAIPRDAEATIIVPARFKERIRVIMNIHISETEEMLGDIEPGFGMYMDSCGIPADAFTPKDSLLLIRTLNACPHGVIAMSRDIPGLVETSTNLASVKMPDENTVLITTSQRSSSEPARHELSARMESLFSLASARVEQNGGYPGWKPNLQSALLEQARLSYQALFDAEPAVKAIHAGLECGLFLEKYPGLDMISVGPQMHGVHSPDERLSISSTQKTWLWFTALLARL
jgi:dipeptidase D